MDHGAQTHGGQRQRGKYGLRQGGHPKQVTMRISINNERGTVLVTTLIITGLVTLSVAALLMIVKQQSYFSARSQTWCSEIPIAEAGVEEAMAHINSRPRRIWTNGWTVSGTNVYKRRNVGDGYFYT